MRDARRLEVDARRREEVAEGEGAVVASGQRVVAGLNAPRPVPRRRVLDPDVVARLERLQERVEVGQST